MIVDCHTHWGICWESRDHGDPARWLEALDRHGVGRALVMPHGGLCRLDECGRDNDTVAGLARRAPERIVPIGCAWPQMKCGGVAEVMRCVEELGMRGLKFHPWLQGFSTADPDFQALCGLAGEMKVPVFFHDGTPCYCLSEQIGGLARRFPATRFVLGHAGLLWTWRSALEACRRPNVWLCLCGPSMRAIEILCRQADTDRIVWGTDYGFGWADMMAYRLRLLRSSRVDAAVMEKILESNPLRLLQVE